VGGPRPTSIPSGFSHHDPSSCLVTTAIWAEIWEVCYWGELGPHHNVAWAEDYLRTKLHLGSSSRFSHKQIWAENWRLRAPLRGSWVPIDTMLPGPRATSLPSGILIYPALWPQQTWAENWGLCPFLGGGLGPDLTHCGRGRCHTPCQVSTSSIQPFDHNTPTLQTD